MITRSIALSIYVSDFYILADVGRQKKGIFFNTDLLIYLFLKVELEYIDGKYTNDTKQGSLGHCKWQHFIRYGIWSDFFKICIKLSRP